jgi:hypothetical protein
MMVDKIKE